MTDALPNPGSSACREGRYRNGFGSSPGACFSRLAQFKAEAVNRAVPEDDNFLVGPVSILDSEYLAGFQIHSRA